MRALVFDPSPRLEPNYRDPALRDGEVLIRVRLAGICRTDVEIARGYMNFRGVAGHEFVGEVVEPDHHPLIGRRVVGEINAACGRCKVCRRGLPRHCSRRTVLGIAGRDGAFADFLTLPARNLHLVDDAISDSQAVFVEPLAAAFEILEQTNISANDRVLVIGDGKLGLLCVLVLQRVGCELFLSGRHPERMARIQPCHVTWLHAGERPDEPFDLVVEASGRADGLARALELVRPRGTVVLKTTIADAHTVNLAPVVIDEIALLGSRCGPFRPALRALGAGDVRTEPLIEATYPLDNALAALEHAGRPGALKILLQP